MKNMDPRVKLEFIVLSTAAAVFSNSPLFLGILAAITLAMTAAYGGDIASFIKKFKGFALILLWIAIAQAVFVRTGTPVVNINNFTPVFSDGIAAGAASALRFFVIMCAACVMAGEDSRKIVQSLVNMKIPYFFAFMLIIALRFIPFFSEAFSQSMISIQLRGVELKKISLPKRLRLFSYLLLPVMAEAIIRAQDLAVSMEARGFGAFPMRTSVIRLKLTRADILLLILQAAAFAGAIILIS